MSNIFLHVRCTGQAGLQTCGLTCLFVFCSWPARCCPCSTRPSIRRRNRRKTCSSSSPCTAVPRCNPACCQVHSTHYMYSPHIPQPSAARVSHPRARPARSSSMFYCDRDANRFSPVFTHNNSSTMFCDVRLRSPRTMRCSNTSALLQVGSSTWISRSQRCVCRSKPPRSRSIT